MLQFNSAKKTIAIQDLEQGMDFQRILDEFLELDKSLIVQEKNGKRDESRACSKKFTNNYNGVPLKARTYLNWLSTNIRQDKVIVAQDARPLLLDVLVLLSNHLDQQNNVKTNEMPEDDVKKLLVVNFLKAALKLSPAIDYDNLKNHSVSELSSHAQLLFYLGKALRYENAPLEQRLAMFNNAVKIGNYLDKLGPEQATADKHRFDNRDATYKLPIIFCLQEKGHFAEAAELIRTQLNSDAKFHRILAKTHMAENYLKAYQFGKTSTAKESKEIKEADKAETGKSDLDNALSFAELAVDEARGENNNAKYNALVCLMKIHEEAQSLDAATEIAANILSDHDKNSACGARFAHLEAAKHLLEEHGQSLAFGR